MFACSRGEMLGCTTLGMLEKQGKEEGKAGLYASRRELERGCEADVAPACDALGSLHARGLGVERDVKRGFELYKKACELGSRLACARASKLPGMQTP